MNAQVIHGDCMDVLAGMAANTVDAIVCDPPYEIGFMGKGWDGSGIAYRVELWAECLRVLKPGGHLLAFGGTRTYHRMTSAIDDAGFDIRDSLHWIYGSGFPKSLDVSKAIDKAAGAERPRQWSGWGTALKPAHEPIVVARKPLVGTVAGNVLAYGTGALNIDGCRVGSDVIATHHTERPAGHALVGRGAKATGKVTEHTGRWPANLVLTHAHNCADRCADGCPVAELDRQSGVSKDGVAVRHNGVKGGAIGPPGAKPVGTPDMGYGGQGGASRFFTVTEWDPTADVAPFRYVAKPSKRERNAGLDGLEERNREDQSSWVRECGTCGCRFTDPTTSRPKCEHDDVIYTAPSPTKNFHPTVKPVALMRWLVRLVTPPGGTVLDPFAGSGTTLVAATLEGFHSIGIELTDDYHPIIAGRLAWAETHTGTSHPPRAPTTARTATPTTEPPLTLFDVGATE